MEENKRNKWLHIRLKESELIQIKGHFQQTDHENLSDYSRRILLKKPIIGKYRDTGMEELLKELFGLKRDLHGLATNYNQLAKKLNIATQNEIDSSRVVVQKLEQSIQESLQKVSHFLDQSAEKWLQS